MRLVFFCMGFDTGGLRLLDRPWRTLVSPLDLLVDRKFSRPSLRYARCATGSAKAAFGCTQKRSPQPSSGWTKKVIGLAGFSAGTVKASRPTSKALSFDPTLTLGLLYAGYAARKRCLPNATTITLSRGRVGLRELQGEKNFAYRQYGFRVTVAGFTRLA